jgi:hypothetical protein
MTGPDRHGACAAEDAEEVAGGIAATIAAKGILGGRPKGVKYQMRRVRQMRRATGPVAGGAADLHDC